MKFLQQLASILLCLSLAVGVAAGAWWLVTNKPAGSKAEKPPSAATVAKPIKEEELNTITLTPEAEKRLGVQVGAVEKKPVRRARIYGGEVTIPVGQAIMVSAPLGGMLKALPSGMPKPGQLVKKGQPVLQLLPLLSPEGRTSMSQALVDAEGQINNARTQVDAARIALDRAKRLLRSEAGSQRNVDEAQATYDLARKTLEAIQARRTMLTKVVGEVESGTAAPIALDAPQNGILRTVSALPGQNVPSGATLFEVVDLTTIWVRVPLPVGDLNDIVRTEDAQVGALSASPGARLHSAKPVLAPPSANPVSATIDLFYEMPNSHGNLIPGQRVGVTISLADSHESLTVPWGAVVFDIYGGTWVYEQTNARTYARRHVVIRHVVGSDAVLASGPEVGTKVVVEGSQELFGAETGFTK